MKIFRIQTVASSIADWAGLLQTLTGCIRIKEICDMHQIPLFNKVGTISQLDQCQSQCAEICVRLCLMLVSLFMNWRIH